VSRYVYKQQPSDQASDEKTVYNGKPIFLIYMEGKRKGVQVRCEKSGERGTARNVMKRFDEVEPIKVNKTRIVKSITTGKSQ
jgi:hypothetical protein